MPEDDSTETTEAVDDAAETSGEDVAGATGLPATGGGEGSGDAEGDAEAEPAAPAAEGGGDGSGRLDVEAAETRLQEVEKEIDEGRRALADLEEEIEPEPEGPPVAEGEGAANAPPG